jgi:hypothetical protein
LATTLSGVIASASAAVLVVAGSPARDGREAAGVFPPWWTQGRVMAAAGAAGEIRQLGGVPFVIVVHDPAGRAPERLRRSGALFSVAPDGALFCGS